MQRQLSGRRAAATVWPCALAMALLAGCRVNDRGLNITVDASPLRDTGATVDAPADLALVDAGPDLACGPCDTATTFVTLPGGRFRGTTSGASASEGTCGGGAAPESVFKIVLSAASDLFVTTHGTGFDTVVYLRDGCCGAEVACNDNADDHDTSVLRARGLAPGTYYIFVDGATADDAGDFTADIYATAAAAKAADSCGSPTRIGAADLSGSNCGFQDDYNYSATPGCTGSVSGSSGFDQVYYFVLDEGGEVTFSTCDNTCVDTVLYVRDVCSDTGTQRACDDDSCRASGACQPAGNQVQSRLTAKLSAGVHYLVVDTFAAAQDACGAFTIKTTGVP